MRRFRLSAIALSLMGGLLASPHGAKAQCPTAINYAIQCNGNQFVKVPNATSLSALSQITVECFARQDVALSTTGGLVGKWNDLQGQNQRGYVLWMVGGHPTFTISHTGADFTSVQSPTAVDFGAWHHIAATYDGAVMRLYVDGAQVAATAATGSINPTPSQPLYIGTALAGGGQTAVGFNGAIDEVRVWSVARTPEEIWKNRNCRVSYAADMVGGWNFDTVTGQTVSDSTQGNNTGTLGNTTGVDAYDPTIIISGELAYPVTVNFPTQAAGSAAASACVPAGTLTLDLSIGFSSATSIQWYKNGVALVNGPTGTGSTVSGQSEFTLVISNTSSADSGQYSCHVGGCSTSASNQLQVTICGGPVTGACCNGPACTLTSGAACTGAGTHYSGDGSTCNTSGNNKAPCCRADFNGSGSLNVQDIFDFLAAWFAANPKADFNGTSGLNVQDIFDFLAAWFAGC